MQTRLPPAVYDQLLVLREAQAQLARYTLHMSGSARANDAVRLALTEAARVAADHARRLDPLIAQWSREDPAPFPVEPEEAPASANREVVESWIAVAEDACELYDQAAALATSPSAAAELRRLAAEEATIVERLRGLL